MDKTYPICSGMSRKSRFITMPMTRKNAESKFKQKLVVIDGHKDHTPTFKWEKGVPNAWSSRSDRDIMAVSCKACKDWHTGNWYVNKTGAISQTHVSTFIAHIIRERPLLDDIEAEKVMIVTMRRGGTHDFWVAHTNDDDFYEAIGLKEGSYPYAWVKQKSTPFAAWKLNTTGSWHILGTTVTRDEAIALCIRQRIKYTNKGYETELLTEASTGHIPPAATVAISVKKLINEYKTAKTKSPYEMKQWLDKTGKALTQMEILQTLHDEVQEQYLESMTL